MRPSPTRPASAALRAPAAATSSGGGAGADDQARRGVRDAADDAPDERALSLRVGSRMEVIGDESELEAVVLGQPGEADEVVGTMLFAAELVAELHHRRTSAGAPAA